MLLDLNPALTVTIYSGSSDERDDVIQGRRPVGRLGGRIPGQKQELTDIIKIAHATFKASIGKGFRGV